MTKKFKMIKTRNTWELVDKPEAKDIINLNRGYKKYNEDSSIQNKRAHLIADDYSQQEGIDFNEIYALIVRMSRIM